MFARCVHLSWSLPLWRPLLSSLVVPIPYFLRVVIYVLFPDSEGSRLSQVRVFFPCHSCVSGLFFPGLIWVRLLAINFPTNQFLDSRWPCVLLAFLVVIITFTFGGLILLRRWLFWLSVFLFRGFRYLCYFPYWSNCCFSGSGR